MLSDYISEYRQAQLENNIKEMNRIEKALAKLGMDGYTLLAVVKELAKEERK